MLQETQNPEKQFPFFTVFLICIVIIFLWLIPFISHYFQPEGSGLGIWGIFEIVALITTVLAPPVYGWYTKERVGAIIIGSLPVLFVMLLMRTVLLSDSVLPGTSFGMVVYVISLAITGGLAGYLAALHEQKALCIATVLVLIWIGIFLSGIN